MKGSFKRIFTWLALSACALTLICAGLWGVIQTKAGKSAAAAFLSAALSRGEATVEISGLELLLPHRLEFEKLTVCDRHGEWLAVDGVFLRWKPWSLVRGEIRVKDMGARSIHIMRMPEAGGGEAKTLGGVPWQLLGRLSISSASLEVISLDEPVIGMPMRLRLNASVARASQRSGFVVSFNLERMDKPGGHARLRASVDTLSRTLTLDGHISDPPGGVVATMAGRPVQVDATISGSGPLSMWAGSIDATVGDLGEVDLDLTLKAVGGNIRVAGNGKATLFSALTGRFEDDRIELIFDAAFSGKDEMDLYRLRLAHQDAEFSARGGFHRIGGSLKGSFSLDVRDLSGLIPAAFPLAGGLKAEGKLGGTIMRPVLDAEVAGTDVCAYDFAADRLTGSVHTVFSGDWRQPLLDVSGGLSALGAVFPGGISFPESAVSVNGDVRLTADGALSGKAEATIGSWLSTRFRGSLSSGRELEADGKIEATDLSFASGLAGIPLAGASKLNFSIRTTDVEPLVVHVDGEAESTLLTRLGGRPWPGRELRYRGTLRLDENKRLHLADAVVTDDIFRLTGASSLLLLDRSFSGKIDLYVADLSRFSSIAAAPLSGQAGFQMRVEGKPGELTAEIMCDIFDVGAGGISVDQAVIIMNAHGWFPDITGSLSIDLAAGAHRFDLNAGIRSNRGRTEFDGISLQLPGATIQGDLRLLHQTMLAEGVLECRIKDPGRLLKRSLTGEGTAKVRFFHDGKEQKAGFHLKGSQIDTGYGSVTGLNAEGELTGLFPTRVASASCTVSGLKAGEVLISSATARGELSDRDWSVDVTSEGTFRSAFSSRIFASLSGGPEKRVIAVNKLDHVHGGVPVKLDSPARIAFAGGKISVEHVSLSIGRGTLRGSGVVAGTASVSEIDASYRRLPLALAAALGYDAGEGAVSGKLYLSPAAEERLLQLDVLIEGFRPPGFRRDQFSALDAHVRVKAGKDRIEGNGEIRGPGESPLTVNVALPIEYRGSSTLPCFAPGEAVQGRLAWTFDVKDLEGLGLRVPGDLSGRADLQIELRGTAEYPEIEGVLYVEDGAYRNPKTGTVIENIGLSSSAHTLPAGRPDRLALAANVSGISTSPFEIGVKLPFALSLAPFSFATAGDGALSGFLRGDMDLAVVSPALSLDRHYIQGLMKFDFYLSGTAYQPIVTGSAHVDGGYFEDVRTGTVFKDIILDVEASPRRVDIVRGEAQAGDGGKVKVGGWVEATRGEAISYFITLEMEDAALLRRDDAYAVADGALSLGGKGREASVSGSVQVKRAEITIPDRTADDIPQLEVVEIHKDGPVEPQTPSSEKPRSIPVSLDLTLESPGQMFVAGRGLDSEWKGVVYIKGASPDIEVTGNFSLIRGYFSLLGRRFTLTRGTIQLGGTPGAPPIINVQGQASSEGMTAEVSVSGPATSPSIHFSSNPSYPSDEILARLLFGRSVDSLTPFQAVQLAQAVQTLAGGGGLDIIGRTRKLLGIDQLELMQSDKHEGEASIRAGKYINDRIYFQVEQGVGSDSSRVSVEMELTPNLSVETEIGADSRGGVGIKWKWDY